MTKVLYKLDTFEGPLDLLLHLIEKNEVDIYDIPVSTITDQYMEYLGTMQELELEITSEFLVMAATLLSIKSKMLLPKPPIIELDMGDYEDEDLDPRAELVQKLIEYRKFKSIAEELREKEVERSLIYTREPEDLSAFIPELEDNPVRGLRLADLVIAFQKAMKRAQSRNSVARIQRDEISVRDRMRQLVDLLDEKGGTLLFLKLFDENTTRDDIVVTFMALLELMKVKEISCYQHELFGDIVITAREDREHHGIPGTEIRH
ncbi:segregation and condensation protein A [Paenibacillus sp. y28]|uniref:segregation and condensation protein A n=1 Tax=Paenibacillus sp. y28 TaxID=3129110 RepID=UPI00301875D8